jgi:hypothetical protein
MTLALVPHLTLVALLATSFARAAIPPGDADCNGALEAADTTAVAEAVFEGSTCAAADANGDARLTAADLPAEVHLLAMPVTATPVATATPVHTHFGVLASGERVARPDVVDDLTDLGAGWVRVNLALDGTPSNDQDLALFLDAGINVVLTLSYRDAANIDTQYGTPAEWPNAGFPFVTKAQYQQDLRDGLSAVSSFLDSGRVWVQCENEVGDASLNPQARFWRGTTDQYLSELTAFYEAVRLLTPSAPVVLSSFASESLDVVIDPNDPRYTYQTMRMTTLLTHGQYDAADLHFYRCVEDIAAKAHWVTAHLPAGKQWISTENAGPDSRCPTTPISWQDDLPHFEQVEAQQVPVRLSACADSGGSICLWFSLFDLRNETDVFSHFGLLDSSTIPPRQKPAYAAFKAFTANASISATASP